VIPPALLFLLSIALAIRSLLCDSIFLLCLSLKVDYLCFGYFCIPWEYSNASNTGLHLAILTCSLSFIFLYCLCLFMACHFSHPKIRKTTRGVAKKFLLMNQVISLWFASKPWKLEVEIGLVAIKLWYKTPWLWSSVVVSSRNSFSVATRRRV
jgi:hypothetical protein